MKTRDLDDLSKLQMYAKALCILTAHRTGDIICRAQSKCVALCSQVIKNIKTVPAGQESKRGTLPKCGAPSDHTGLMPMKLALIAEEGWKGDLLQSPPSRISAVHGRFLWLEYQFIEL